QVSARGVRVAHGIGGDACQPQLLQGARKRAGKAGQSGYRREITQRRLAGGCEDRARRNRLRAKTAAWRLAFLRERDDGGPRRQLRQAESRKTKRRATLESNGPGEVIGRATRRADDGDRMMSGELTDECRRGLKSRRGGGRLEDAERWSFVHR